jgi:hypothetical protein
LLGKQLLIVLDCFPVSLLSAPLFLWTHISAGSSVP